MRPFLHLSVRDDDLATAEEHTALLRFTGLADDELAHRRVERASLAGLDPTAFSGIILGGSPYDWTAPEAKKDALQRRIETELTELVRRVIDADLPFLGLCYGVGAVAAACDVPLTRAHPEDARLARVAVTPAGRDDPLLADAPELLHAFVGHHEGLAATPRNAALLAVGDIAPVQMLRVGSRVYATQFHPELDQSGFIRRAARYDGHGYYPDGHLDRVDEATRDVDTSAAHALLRRFTEVARR